MTSISLFQGRSSNTAFVTVISDGSSLDIAPTTLLATGSPGNSKNQLPSFRRGIELLTLVTNPPAGKRPYEERKPYRLLKEHGIRIDPALLEVLAAF